MALTWLPRLLTMAIWALAAWSAGVWVLKFAGAVPSAAPPANVPTTSPASEPGNVARVFGPAIEKPGETASAPADADPSTRFALVGVVANRASIGVALLSVDGKPARPYRVGSTIDDGFILKGVSVRSAAIAAPGSDATFTVNLSALPVGAGAATAPTAATAATVPVPSGVPGRSSRLAPSFRPAPAASAARPES